MGCTDSVESQNPKYLSSDKRKMGNISLDLKLRNLRITLEQKQKKVQGRLTKNILELEKMFKMTLKSRNKVMEYQKIEQSTWLKNEEHVYEIIIGYVKVLEQYKTLLNDPNNWEKLKVQIINIFHAKQAIECDQLQEFCAQILKLYPSLNSKESKSEEEKFLIKDEILMHHINNRLPTKVMINEFALGLPQKIQNEITYQMIIASGNNFKYGLA